MSFQFADALPAVVSGVSPLKQFTLSTPHSSNTRGYEIDAKSGALVDVWMRCSKTALATDKFVPATSWEKQLKTLCMKMHSGTSFLPFLQSEPWVEFSTRDGVVEQRKLWCQLGRAPLIHDGSPEASAVMRTILGEILEVFGVDAQTSEDVLEYATTVPANTGPVTIGVTTTSGRPVVKLETAVEPSLDAQGKRATLEKLLLHSGGDGIPQELEAIFEDNLLVAVGKEFGSSAPTPTIDFAAASGGIASWLAFHARRIGVPDDLVFSLAHWQKRNAHSQVTLLSVTLDDGHVAPNKIYLTVSTDNYTREQSPAVTY